MSTHNICFCGEIRKYLPDTYSYLDLGIPGLKHAMDTHLKCICTTKCVLMQELEYFFLFLHKKRMLWVLVRSNLARHF